MARKGKLIQDVGGMADKLIATDVNGNIEFLDKALLGGGGNGGAIEWSQIILTPTTLSGYGITDAAPLNHSHAFSSLTNKPTTLSGYGITDGALGNHNHNGVYEPAFTTLPDTKLSSNVAFLDKANNFLFRQRIRTAGSADDAFAVTIGNSSFHTWFVTGDGTHYFGSTGSNYDVTLRRSAVGTLDVMGTLKASKFTEGGVDLVNKYELKFSKNLHSFDSLTGRPTTLSGYGITDGANKVHTHSFSDITNKPTTRDGYGITDVYTKAQTDALVGVSGHTHQFSEITNKPTTLSGYGITDAAPLSHTQAWSTITSRPTTLTGYGITDTYTKTESDSTFVKPNTAVTFTTVNATSVTTTAKVNGGGGLQENGVDLSNKYVLQSSVPIKTTLTLTHAATVTCNLATRTNFFMDMNAKSNFTLQLSNVQDGDFLIVDLDNCSAQTITFGAVTGFNHFVAGVGNSNSITLPSGGAIISARVVGTKIKWLSDAF
jgi:hypothetical protein